MQILLHNKSDMFLILFATLYEWLFKIISLEDLTYVTAWVVFVLMSLRVWIAILEIKGRKNERKDT